MSEPLEKDGLELQELQEVNVPVPSKEAEEQVDGVDASLSEVKVAPVELAEVAQGQRDQDSLPEAQAEASEIESKDGARASDEPQEVSGTPVKAGDLSNDKVDSPKSTAGTPSKPAAPKRPLVKSANGAGTGDVKVIRSGVFGG